MTLESLLILYDPVYKKKKRECFFMAALFDPKPKVGHFFTTPHGLLEM
jgi:hypothetical protein